LTDEFVPISAHGFELAHWQKQALAAWRAGDGVAPCRGTLEIFTGGGKTLIALEAFAEATRQEPTLRLAVVVPTEALARQWRDALLHFTNLGRTDVGMLGAGAKDDLATSRVLVAVLNSASRYLPGMALGAQPLMLVVDECHRAGAPSFSRVLDTVAAYRMGLSATPDREDVDEDGEPIEYDAHRLGLQLGGVVFRFGLDKAREAGWLPKFEIHHHGVHLDLAERVRYETLSREIDDLLTRLRHLGHESSDARRLAHRSDDTGVTARAYVACVATRKDLLYRAAERTRIARILVNDALANGASRILLFHERVAEASDLWNQLVADHGGEAVVLEHSALPDRTRKRALAGFRDGSAKVLVSVRSLIEGINVPDADVGISVAASSSTRQRIQALGRVLRRQTVEGVEKVAWMHLLYVADTVDEAIYSKEDWSDLTGTESNRYWLWPGGDGVVQPAAGPPRRPRRLEQAEWERLGGRPPERPVEWFGVIPDREYSVDAFGNVSTASGRRVTNPQDVGAMVRGVTGSTGGKFRVTPIHRLVLVGHRVDDEFRYLVGGSLDSPFELRVDSAMAPESAGVDVTALEPGSPYPGPLDSRQGDFALRSVGGGSVARKTTKGVQFALRSSDDVEATRNVDRVLSAWRRIGGLGRPFHVNSLGHAWLEQDGSPIFLADVPGGFLFRMDSPKSVEGE
jgi:superfamily II DNA or RNA helicase